MIAKATDLVLHSSRKAAVARHDVEFVTFRVDTQWFGLPVGMVQEVLTGQRVSRVPLAPPTVQGFLNLRGQIVTAVDVRTRLAMPTRAEDASVRNVVVREGGELFALLVDEVNDVLTVSIDAVESVPSTLDPRWAAASEGVVRQDAGLLVILRAEALLATESAVAA